MSWNWKIFVFKFCSHKIYKEYTQTYIRVCLYKNTFFSLNDKHLKNCQNTFPLFIAALRGGIPAKNLFAQSNTKLPPTSSAHVPSTCLMTYVHSMYVCMCMYKNLYVCSRYIWGTRNFRLCFVILLQRSFQVVVGAPWVAPKDTTTFQFFCALKYICVCIHFFNT